LPAAAVERKVEVASPLSPEKWKRSARTTAPARFPSQQTIQTFAASASVTVFFMMPRLMTMVLPVKSSEPAITTRERAIPKETPMTVLVAGEPASCPPITLMRILPNPM
jgi:hypothetical protein